MKKYVLKAESFAMTGEVFVGIDASKARLAIAVVRRHGPELEVILTRSIANTSEAVASFFRGFEHAKVYAVYEAGPTGYALLRWLEAAGVEAFMTPPSLVPVAAGDRVKTDARDAVKLATLLAGGQLRRVRALTDERYADREIVRARQRAVEARRRILQQIKSLLLFHAVPAELPKAGLSKRTLLALERYAGGTVQLREALKQEAGRFRTANQEVRNATQLLTELAALPRYASDLALLDGIYGVGIVTGLTILVERGERHFASCADFASYCGLTPSEFSTGQTRHQGGITRQGNARLRAVLVEAVWRWVRGDDKAREQFEALSQRLRSKKKAAVAMARRLATVIHAMLRDRRPYVHGQAESATTPHAA